nr:hypothetical protein [Candidatus Gastranaerophilales bacterium]
DDLTYIEILKNNPEENKDYKRIKTYPKPLILSFLSDSDYEYLLFLFVLLKRIKNYKVEKEFLNRPYSYSNKFDWSDCLAIMQRYENYKIYDESNIIEMEKNGIKKVKLVCNEKCKCCKNFINKSISIKNIKELPIKDSEPDSSFCKGAVYQAIIDYDD